MRRKTSKNATNVGSNISKYGKVTTYKKEKKKNRERDRVREITKQVKTHENNLSFHQQKQA